MNFTFFKKIRILNFILNIYYSLTLSKIIKCKKLKIENYEEFEFYSIK